jgi:hypothetical protein
MKKIQTGAGNGGGISSWKGTIYHFVIVSLLLFGPIYSYSILAIRVTVNPKYKYKLFMIYE